VHGKGFLIGAAGALAVVTGGAGGASATDVASAPPRATTIRIGSHPAFVRVVVQFAGSAAPSANDVVAATGGRLRNVTASVAGARSTAAPVTAWGVRASIVRSPSGIVVRMRTTAGRFAYVRYVTLAHPGRLSIDLIRSFSTAAYSTGGCFTHGSAASAAGSVTARYRLARPIFENQWILRVRRADGAPVGAVTPQSGTPGTYTTMVLTPVARPQRGVVDILDAGAKDAGIACLTRVPVRLRP
jgi:hypothetical protein